MAKQNKNENKSYHIAHLAENHSAARRVRSLVVD